MTKKGKPNDPSGLRGPDPQQGDLQDNRRGAYDPLANQKVPDTNHQTVREKAQPGADVRGEPIAAGTVPCEDYALPEGLKRERKGPLNKSEGRGGSASHVPSHAPRSRSSIRGN